MDPKKKVSNAVIKRLPRYYRYLSDLLKINTSRISSRELSEKMGITASQIRQDLNCFGGFGQQGYGYNVQDLYEEIGMILGIKEGFKIIIVGAGKVGQALANYNNLEKRGFHIIGIFDINPKLVGQNIKNIEIFHLDKLDKFIKDNKVDIAILTVPFDQTPIIADRIARLGVKGLWNFSPMDLELPYDVIIENVHLSDSIMVLGYKLNEKRKSEDNE